MESEKAQDTQLNTDMDLKNRLCAVTVQVLHLPHKSEPWYRYRTPPRHIGQLKIAYSRPVQSRFVDSL
jgi:hypothetical protein